MRLVGPPLIDAGAMQDALRRCLHGEPYSGPEIKWTCGNLAATRPEPHIALSAEYLAMNPDIEVDERYIASLMWACGMEQGWRMAVREALTDQHYGLRWPRREDVGN